MIIYYEAVEIKQTGQASGAVVEKYKETSLDALNADLNPSKTYKKFKHYCYHDEKENKPCTTELITATSEVD